jgi:hypothetical protein
LKTPASSKLAGLTGFLPRRKLYLRLCYGEASRRSQFPTVSVRPGEAMSDDDLRLRNRPWQRFIESGRPGSSEIMPFSLSRREHAWSLSRRRAETVPGVYGRWVHRAHSQHTSRSFFTAGPATGSNLPSHACATRSNAHVMSIELRPNDFASLRAFASADEFIQISDIPAAVHPPAYTYLKEGLHDARNRKVVQQSKRLRIYPTG